MTTGKKFMPMEVTDAQMAFGGGELIPYADWAGSDFMPAREDIPEDFLNMNDRTKWNRLTSKWFYDGLPEDTEFVPNKGIDAELAYRHIRTIIGSWTPKHEHKTAAVAYLMSLWFKDIRCSTGSLLK